MTDYGDFRQGQATKYLPACSFPHFPSWAGMTNEQNWNLFKFSYFVSFPCRTVEVFKFDVFLSEIFFLMFNGSFHKTCNLIWKINSSV